MCVFSTWVRESAIAVTGAGRRPTGTRVPKGAHFAREGIPRGSEVEFSWWRMTDGPDVPVMAADVMTVDSSLGFLALIQRNHHDIVISKVYRGPQQQSCTSRKRHGGSEEFARMNVFLVEEFTKKIQLPVGSVLSLLASCCHRKVRL